MQVTLAKSKNYEQKDLKDGQEKETDETLLNRINNERTQNETPEISKGNPRKGRKRKYPYQTRKEKKTRKYSNKPYYNYKGVQINAKVFLDFNCGCISKCAENVPVETRKFEFDRFWSLKSYDSQTNFIAASVSEIEKKRTYGRNTEKRKFSRIYKVKDTKVCREMFIKTLGVTTCRVNTALKKFHGRVPISDQRGLKQGGKNKLPGETLSNRPDNEPTQNETAEKSKKIPQKGRKRKYPFQTRKDKKIKKYSNKPYYNYKGVQINAKTFLDFNCDCITKCAENVPVETRKFEFDRFWSLKSYDSQTNFIAASVSEIEKKRTYGSNTEKRKFSRIYKIKDTKVCREMFIKTLGITTCRVNTALKKFHGRVPISDQRGLKQGGKNKLPEEKVQLVN